MIQRAFRICTTLYTKPIRENFYFHYLPKLYIGFNHWYINKEKQGPYLFVGRMRVNPKVVIVQ